DRSNARLYRRRQIASFAAFEHRPANALPKIGLIEIMQDMKKFLSAKWIDLIMVNYEVDPGVLAPLVPAGTEIDLFDGKCFVSLVAFMFLDTRVSDFLVPFHVNFEEVNLRFYVKRETEGEIRRGVVFVKEIVPRAAIAFVARSLY